MSMRPTFMGFETATRGLMANQKALDIVANNSTNVATTGYTRQRVDMVSLNVNMRYTRYNQNSVAFAGQGAAVYGVSQIRDTFLDKRFREEYADVGYYGVTSSVLEDLAACMDEIAPATMSTAMSEFETAWKELTLKADEPTNAANIRAKAEQIVSVFRQMSAKIDNVWNQQEYSLGLEVDNINSILRRVAQLNETIAQEKYNCMEVGNELYKPLELLDQRNVLLDQLANYADITYQEDADGMVTVKMGGHVAVEGKEYQAMRMATNSNDPNFKTVRVFWNDSGEDINFASGSIRGATDMLNGRGVHGSAKNGEVFNQGLLYYKDKINMFASTMADAFNNVVELADNNGNPFDPPQYKQLFSFETDAYNGASNIMINPDWEADAAYLVTGVVEKIDNGSDTNSPFAAAYALFEKELDFGEFKGTINSYITYYSHTKLSNDKAYADSRLAAVTTISDNLLNQIQQISGVSLEEEGVDMLMYKKAYDAVSRVFTTLDEMLDKLINGTGIVGR